MRRRPTQNGFKTAALLALAASVPLGMLVWALSRPSDDISYEMLADSGLMAFLWALLPSAGVTIEAFKQGRRYAATFDTRRNVIVAGLCRYARGRPLAAFLVFSLVGIVSSTVAYVVYGAEKGLEGTPIVLAAWIGGQCVAIPAAFLLGRLFPKRSSHPAPQR